MKKILGLDLGTTSIGWAFVHEADEQHETSQIIKTGVRVVPLSSDEQQDFAKGNPITLNAQRTLDRSARRNRQRYKQRRDNLLTILKSIGFISNSSTLSEIGKDSTHQLYNLRSKSVTEQVTKEDFARILLTINKKRGYKSSRKTSNTDEGALIDGMAISKKLITENITPGQLAFELTKKGVKKLPDFYKSDLEKEFDTIWYFQQKNVPLLTETHYKNLKGKNVNTSKQYFEKTIGVEIFEIKGKNKKEQLLEYRSKAVKETLDLSQLALVFSDINNQINQSSNYLAKISDRSKELYFKNLTVGQYQLQLLENNPNTSLRNQVFYRQDYIDEFEKIWAKQAEFYPELNDNLKKKIKDEIIFYQRRLKSQKGLVSICQLESFKKKIKINDKEVVKTIGPKVAPKSSPIFQIAKVWEGINMLKLTHINTNEELTLDDELRFELFNKLQLVDHLKANELLRFLKERTDINPKLWKCNIEKVEGNRTTSLLLKTFLNLLENDGAPALNTKANFTQTLAYIKKHFSNEDIDTNILELDFSLTGNDFAKQPAYEIWHLLYSYEGDDSISGIESLIEKLKTTYRFPETYAKHVAKISFNTDYGNLSVKALRKILPYLEDGFMYHEACSKAGYNHSKSISKEENDKRILIDTIPIIKKNALRNPVVEKILNQMIHVINQIITHPEMGRPDEIRIEIARELKNNAKKRKELSSSIKKASEQNIKDRLYLQKEIGLKHVSRKDLIKFKLYKELKPLGYKTPYSGTYIEVKDLFFTNKFDVEHIIPQSLIFDDSFSNKTLELRKVNLEKGNQTAIDYCTRKGTEIEFKQRVLELKKTNSIGYTKFQKLLQPKSEIGEGFINRDLNNTAYIAKKAMEIAFEVCKSVLSTNGKITNRLRNDWGLIDVLKELNWANYKQLGLTYTITNKEGKELKRIKNWTKRNDHRHHAIDAIAVAFTRREFIQYLSHLNAKNQNDNLGRSVKGIEDKYLCRNKQNNLKFKKPFPNIRKSALDHLSKTLISFKAKNKIATRNINTIKLKNGSLKKIQLTPRGQLHKETIYGKSIIKTVVFEKVDGKMDLNKTETITNTKFKKALQQRLSQYNNDPKKAFTGKNSLGKNPILIKGRLIDIPEKVKCIKNGERFTIRKPISPELRVDKVIDKGIQRILQKRLTEFGGDPKKAFVNLDDNPIWYDTSKTKAIKKVTIEGVSNAIPLHEAKNHLGELISKDGKQIPVDYVSTGNNHHVTIYKNSNGVLTDDITSFFEALVRKTENLPIINSINKNGDLIKFSLKQNEMFIITDDQLHKNDIKINEPTTEEISKRLFRVQKISRVEYGNSVVRDYVFRHHLDTTTETKKELKNITWIALKSLNTLNDYVKVRINHLGEIVHIGEY